MRWLDSITDSTDTHLSKLRGWWRTGERGMPQSTGLQRVGHNWATEQQSMENSAQVDVTATTGRVESRIICLPEHSVADTTVRWCQHFWVKNWNSWAGTSNRPGHLPPRSGGGEKFSLFVILRNFAKFLSKKVTVSVSASNGSPEECILPQRCQESIKSRILNQQWMTEYTLWERLKTSDSCWSKSQQNSEILVRSFIRREKSCRDNRGVIGPVALRGSLWQSACDGGQGQICFYLYC